MPTKISRAEALRRIREEGGAPACLMCAIAARRVGDVHVIVEDEDTLVMLPRYVRRWGHVMALPKRHVTSYAEVDVELWTRTAQLAHQAARVVERVMRPRRCYLASTGSSAGELTQTSRHLHIHVVPLYEPDDKPSDIFSWAGGVYVGAPDEWAELTRRYREAWDDCWP
ncbi:MAG: HIT family protein [Myxococcales bacterium]|nr:HIT family protein [Myxococcales bacterium]